MSPPAEACGWPSGWATGRCSSGSNPDRSSRRCWRWRSASTGEHPLKLRAGITHGRVILFEGDDYIGSAVNLAARLCDGAGPHEILAQPQIAAVLPRWAEHEAVGPVEVRGFYRPVQVIRVRRRACDGPQRRDPVCGMFLDESGVAATRQGPEGPVVFCAESCADAWDARPSVPR